MKLKIALLEKDNRYIKKISGVFNTKYPDKIELYSFTDIEKLNEKLSQKNIDILLVNQNISEDSMNIPNNCTFIYLVEENNINSFKGQHAICKYQKVEDIYKQILNIFSEKAIDYKEIRSTNENIKIVMFTSFSGGVGSSTLAAAYAIKLANYNKKVLYLNLEKNGISDQFFNGNGQFTFSDIIYALKSGNSNLMMKIESSLRNSKEGVDFFSTPLETLDMNEINKDDVETLINELMKNSQYDYIIIDINFNFEEIENYIWEVSGDVVVVCDGCDIANLKFIKSYKSIEILQSNNPNLNLNKMKLIYNKFSNKTSHTLQGINVESIGGIPRFEHATTKQIIAQINMMNIFEKIM